MSEWVVAEAPSNIALIKYMGKVADPTANRSANASLSWTLGHLRTRVRVRWETAAGVKRLWRPLSSSQEAGWHAPELSASGQERYLRHADRCLVRIRAHMEAQGEKVLGESDGESTLVVESANGFPADCGLASSASSFAALTLAMAKLLGMKSETEENRRWLANLSREGSGSSCRSLFTPWSVWGPEGASGVPGLPEESAIRHLALIVDEKKKLVSSSEAHVRVTTSDLFEGRIARAERRLGELLKLLSENGGKPSVATWNQACELTWIEFWDMHALFETAKPPFGYFTSGTMQVLEWIRSYKERAEHERGAVGARLPMVTMDAGPNIHLLLWQDGELDKKAAQSFVAELDGFLKSSGSARLIDSESFR